MKVPSPEAPSANGDVAQLAGDLQALDTTEDKLGAFDAIAASKASEEEADSEKKRPASKDRTLPFKIDSDPSSESGLLTKALLTGNLHLAVELCLEFGRTADALVLAAQGGPELLEKTQKRYFDGCDSAGKRIHEITA